MSKSKLTPFLLLRNDIRTRRQSSAWSLAGIPLLAVLIASKWMAGDVWAMLFGLLFVAYTGYVTFWSHVHPRIYVGKGLALFCLAFSLVLTYLAAGNFAKEYVVRRAFQLAGTLTTYTDAERQWSVQHPQAWRHEQQS